MNFQIPGRNYNLCVADAAQLLCKHLTLISSILTLEHWGFLVSLVICYPFSVLVGIGFCSKVFA